MARWLYWFLLGVPLALLAKFLGWSGVLVFAFSAIALIPLAGLIGESTEKLAEIVGPLVGGLLNATFGNAPELIIGIAALQAGLLDVVRASITGSIIGNTLLVLGMAVFFGGWRNGRQYFDARNAGQYASMLALAVVGLVLPALANAVGPSLAAEEHRIGVNIDAISLLVSVVLLISYVAYLAYTVFHVRDKASRPPAEVREGKTPKSAEDGPPLVPPSPVLAEEQEEELREEAQAERAKRPRARRTKAGAPAASAASVMVQSQATTRHTSYKTHGKKGEGAATPTGHTHRGKPSWKAARWPVALLALATVGTAVMSEFMVGGIETVTEQLGWSQLFIGLIIVPIVGNAAEHASAVTMALKNRMDVTLAIAAGSSIQVALLVAPVLVLVSFLFTHPLDLVFRPLELVVFGLATFLFSLTNLDGESTWLEGFLMLAFYVMVGVIAFFL
jgi:Ca2+:H+ antiporter